MFGNQKVVNNMSNTIGIRKVMWMNINNSLKRWQIAYKRRPESLRH